MGIISVISSIRIIKYTTYNTHNAYNSYPNTKKSLTYTKKMSASPRRVKRNQNTAMYNIYKVYILSEECQQDTSCNG